MRIDLHTHSIASGHGTSDTITDLARAAAAKGITLLGISDHGPAMSGAASISYFRSLSHASRRRFGVDLLFGAELNICSVNGDVDLDDSLLGELDYAIISLHSPVFPHLEAHKHTQAYICAMKHPSVCIVGHPDDMHFPILPEELVIASRDQHILLEINNASLAPDGYRGDSHLADRRILSLCKSYDIPVIIGSDSHGHKHIGDDRYARSLMTELDFPSHLIVNDHPRLLYSYLYKKRAD